MSAVRREITLGGHHVGGHVPATTINVGVHHDDLANLTVDRYGLHVVVGMDRQELAALRDAINTVLVETQPGPQPVACGVFDAADRLIRVIEDVEVDPHTLAPHEHTRSIDADELAEFRRRSSCHCWGTGVHDGELCPACKGSAAREAVAA